MGLVVAVHSVMAYHPFAPPASSFLDAHSRWWRTFPVVDPRRWEGWAIFLFSNDVYFMALMFFLSGLFVHNSLRRKGSGHFLRDRFVRLGVPFIVAAGIIAPVSYYPAYLMSVSDPTVAGFWRGWRALGDWPAGPAWFLWVLLLFDSVTASLYKMAPHWAETLRRNGSTLLRRPIVSYCALVFLSLLAYVPMTRLYGAASWMDWGPFGVQINRLLNYAVYFAAGVVLGAGTLGQTFLSLHGPLARRWWVWAALAILAFSIALRFNLASLHSPNVHHLATLAAMLFSVSCAASSFAMLALFLRFARSSHPLLDDYCAASYGIYLVHLPIVTWTQYILLRFHFSAVLKGILVTLVALSLSWSVIALARRSRVIARII